jgi:hypothetical protein
MRASFRPVLQEGLTAFTLQDESLPNRDIEDDGQAAREIDICIGQSSRRIGVGVWRWWEEVGGDRWLIGR